jgi:uracil-DNA glycosylase
VRQRTVAKAGGSHDRAMKESQSRSLATLRKAARSCRDCPLWANATQTVFGEGDAHAKVMLVGEQPGDKEDLEGHPFVGPAGKLLDRALEEAGVDRKTVYITNAVKHFKWEPRGKRRMHKTPAQREFEACRQWLEAEILSVKPSVIVCLGASAARSLLGPQFRVTKQHGQFVPSDLAPRVFATYHPSAILRAPDPKAREEGYALLVKDLSLIRRALK